MMLPCLAGVTQVIRVWRASDSGREQSSKLVVIRRTTSLIEAARLSAEEFGLMEEERDNYRLVQVSEF
ncbi:unnamed protein product [Protopolystoma xenopodis]|uniref:Ras-associating domain-containing protein n=1 Tax=Protopolystoma xenopodis TaxID=117903 RepID=A0A448WQZ3_9PLAT|nr:unnamed protein product [Protopolystoma xenopodis]